MADATAEQVRRYILDGSDEDLRRLMSLSESFAEHARRAFRRVGVGPGWTVVDCGCGPIGVLSLLAEMVGPTGRVVGVDFSEPSIQRARSVVTALGLENVDLFAGDIHELDAATLGGPFDSYSGTGTLCEVYPVRRCGTIKRWPVHERIELPHLIHRTGHHVHHTTGFDREEIIDLCIRINSVQPGAGSPNWPPCLGLFKSVVAALTYMRHNRTQSEIGESLGVSQPTISRAISAVTSLVPEATREFVPTADDLDPDAQYILDGTLLPCWSWDGHKELYSGKHKTTGMNLQVACTIYGKLAWISDPVNGCRHENDCREESGVLLTINPRNWIGDKGYIGNNMITPFRKPAGGELLDWQKEYNSEVNKIRWMIEQVISHFKNWTIMHTDYRRPLKTFETTISAVVGLHFYRTVPSLPSRGRS